MAIVTNVRCLLAGAMVLAAALPVLSAGAAGCCRVEVAKPRHACCTASATVALATRGCCKAPAHRKPAARANDGVSQATVAAPLELARVSRTIEPAPAVHAVRLARLEHRAASPDDSPPDLLAKTRTLLI